MNNNTHCKQGTTVETAIHKYGDSDISWSSKGKLRLKQNAVRRLFTPVVQNIKEAVKKVISHPSVGGLLSRCASTSSL